MILLPSLKGFFLRKKAAAGQPTTPPAAIHTPRKLVYASPMATESAHSKMTVDT
ncbi:hypothetical protein [Rudaea cellulosilytica]|uniref:hypothetical protein n=1 Tax=Rudaea cellulosilytica TaxID=540746 RepID=UPI00036FD08B|nr:hypothetical protein [Rudaea cellulosilytica]